MIAVGLVLLLAAQDAALDEAKARFAEGKAAYDLGHFDEALASFEAAYKAKPLPGFMFNLGQCHFGLGHYERAVFFYERYLELLPAAPNRELVEQLIAEAKAKEAAARASTATPPPMPPPEEKAPPTAPPPPAAADDGPPWLVIGGAAGAVALLATGVVVAAIVAAPHPPASTLGTLDRSHAP